MANGDQDAGPNRWGVLAWAVVVLGLSFTAAALVEGPAARALTFTTILAAGACALVGQRGRGATRAALFMAAGILTLVAVVTTTVAGPLSDTTDTTDTTADAADAFAAGTPRSVTQTLVPDALATSPSPGDAEPSMLSARPDAPSIDAVEGRLVRGAEATSFFDGELRANLFVIPLTGPQINVSTARRSCEAVILRPVDRFAVQEGDRWYRVSLVTVENPDEAVIRVERSTSQLDATMECVAL